MIIRLLGHGKLRRYSELAEVPCSTEEQHVYNLYLNLVEMVKTSQAPTVIPLLPAQ